MDDTNRNEYEPLIEGLEDLPEDSFRFPQPSEDLRRSVFDRTIRIVRSRARRRHFITVTLVAAAYLGGITTAFLLTETAVRNGGNRDAVVSSRSGNEGTTPTYGNVITAPSELEQRAESATPNERIRLLTRAGDLYLSLQYDVDKALGCYRRALNTMPASRQTVVEPDDSWLLAALKDSRR